jgi:MtrB/PioB family decaheme-associated outer membrane protein
MLRQLGWVRAGLAGAVLSGAALVSTNGLTQTATAANPPPVPTGALAQTPTTGGSAPVSTGVPATMATIANPTPGATAAPAQATTIATAKSKPKKPKRFLTDKQTIPAPPPASTGLSLTLGPTPRPVVGFGGQPQGCCQGGSATGANAWTTGNQVNDWPPTNISPVPYWWTHGEIEVGGRAFLNNPNRDGSAFQQQQSLAKYYEYSSIMPGVFGGGHVAAGSKDGLYQVDLWANNVGYTDESYLLTASKIGEQYLSVGWDETPHVYSTSARTPFNGVGTNHLTVPVQEPTLGTVEPFPNTHQIDIGIQRDTASAAYRWTPTEAWDFNIDYSHLSRDGTQPYGGVIGLGGGTTGYVMVPTPVHDTTQNFGASGEYAGTSFWGQNYTLKLGYKGSLYQDDSLSYTIENPVISAAIPMANESLWPSNQAHGFTGTLAADLPLHSRDVTTVNYTAMTQNSPFNPMSINYTGPPAAGVLPLPESSLNGQINTTLVNNVVTTKITPELTAKLTYRFYDFDNQTPQILFDQWISRDQTTISENTVQTLTMSYIKQNAGAAFNWRPSAQWNFNAEYGFEYYNYTQADVNETYESNGKISADWTPSSWFTVRASGFYGDRRFTNYNYIGNVGSIQFPTVPGFPPSTSSWFYSPAYQQFMFDDRQQTKAQLALDIVAFHGVTVSPTVKYQDDNYGLNVLVQEGLTDSKSLSYGVDVSWAISPDLHIVGSYYKEYYDLLLYGATANAAPTVGNEAMTSDQTTVDTITAGVTWAAIPDKLNFDARAALSQGVDTMRLFLGSGANPTGGQFPDDTTWFEHVDATATYKFDPTTVAKLGWKGDIKAKLRYTWERNAVNNWQNDPVAPFFFPGTTTAQNTSALLMAADNPNYNVHLIAASLVATW